MTATYRLVHFMPDPFSGARFPVGAVVSHGAGGVGIAKSGALASAGCLGSTELAVAAQRLQDRLDQVASADRLPASFGPYALLAEARCVPEGVDDPVAWVQRMLGHGVRPTAPVQRPRRSNRGTQGYRFFETWQVAQHVKKTFRPSTDGHAAFAACAAGLRDVTHWTEGANDLLLMEPVVPSRSSFASDLTKIAQTFMAYRGAFAEMHEGPDPQLVAYITTGGHPDQRAEAREVLAPYAHDVVDTTVVAARDRFLATVREISVSARAQQRLDWSPPA